MLVNLIRHGIGANANSAIFANEILVAEGKLAKLAPLAVAEIVSPFQKLVDQLLDRKIPTEIATRAAEIISSRDEDIDERILCVECRNLLKYKDHWRCNNWLAAGIGYSIHSSGLPVDLLTIPQRCNGFSKV